MTDKREELRKDKERYERSKERRDEADERDRERGVDLDKKRQAQEYERTNQLTTDAAYDEGLATPQAPTRDAEAPSREQLERGVLNPDLIDDRPTPEEWREEHGYDDEERSDTALDDERRDDEDEDEVRRQHERQHRAYKDRGGDDESLLDKAKHKIKGD